ncbi:MAG TPA: hypothetical protein VHM24_13420 [Gemmatimonadaceae bacterium]|nr:hypothetical protein [Gemmatimonadaceae bacterium]
MSSPTVAVKLFPRNAECVAASEAGDSGEDPSRDHDAEEVPETFHKAAALELCSEQPPGKRRRANEPGKKAKVCGEIFYYRPAKLIELRENRYSLVEGPFTNVRRGGWIVSRTRARSTYGGHSACSSQAGHPT